MVKFNNLLLGAAKISIEAEKILEDILELPKVSLRTDINKYLCLIDDMVAQITLIVKVRYLETGEEKMKKYINDVFQYASKLMELDYKLSREEGNKDYIDVLSKLRVNMTKLQGVLSKLAWEVLMVYGPREAMMIVTPGYQVLSGIWIEYRRVVLPMEA
jgi:Asp-tRNA(Asn)/Glu-tRNA(Gln) amidotransferase C subunit